MRLTESGSTTGLRFDSESPPPLHPSPPIIPPGPSFPSLGFLLFLPFLPAFPAFLGLQGLLPSYCFSCLPFRLSFLRLLRAYFR